MRTTMNNESSTPAGIRIFVLDSVVIDHKECLVGVAAPGVCVMGGGGGGGGTLIFSYIHRLGPFLGIQNFQFQYFWGFSEK